MSKIYISSPVSSYQKDWNLKVAKTLESLEHKVLLPQNITPKSADHTKFEVSVYKKCVRMINSCDFGLLLYPYGRDCAWEVGYFNGIGKSIYAFISKFGKKEEERLRDWMVKGSLTGVITNNKRAFEQIQKDMILKHKKVVLIKDVTELNFILERKY